MQNRMKTSAFIHIADDETAFLETASIPLFERAILSGQKAGIDAFFIFCSGKNRSQTENTLRMDKRVRSDIRIIAVQNRIDKEIFDDILSIPDQRYVIIEANTFFSHRLLQTFSQLSLKDAVAAIAIDTTDSASSEEQIERDSHVFSKNWHVTVSGKRISAISRELKDYHGSVAGIVLASPELITLFIKSLNTDASSSIYKCMAQDICHKKILAYDITNNICMKVFSQQQLQECENRLYNSLGSSVDGPVVDKYINRRLSRLITRQMVKTNITPNQTTFLSLVIGIVSAWFFLLGGYWNCLVGGLVFQLSFVFDQCDGEIARIKFMESKLGGWFDAFCDSIIRTFIILGMTVSLFAESRQSLILILGMLSSIGIFVSTMAGSYETLRKEEEANLENRDSAHISTGEESKLGALVDKFNNTDSFTIILFISLLSGHLAWFLWTVGIGSFVFSFVILVKSLVFSKRCFVAKVRFEKG